MNKHEIRQEVVSEFKSLVFGPRGGPNEFIPGKRGLILRYLTGILFPVGQSRGDIASSAEAGDYEDESGGDISSGEEFSADQDNPLSMANEELPSSVGITFTVRKNTTLYINCSGASYSFIENDAGDKGYRRYPLTTDIELKASLDLPRDEIIFDGLAKLQITVRPSPRNSENLIITLSLINKQKSDKKSKKSAPEKCIFQTALRCSVSNGETFEKYDYAENVSTDIEEKILSMQYMDKPVYAVGHGSSVNWVVNNNNSYIEIDYIPNEYVYRPTFDNLKLENGSTFERMDVLDIARLSDSNIDKASIIDGLFKFANFYKSWIKLQSEIKVGSYKNEKDYLITEMQTCYDRIYAGITELNENDLFWESFQESNRAMLLNMLQNSHIKKLKKQREEDNLQWPIPIEELNSDYFEFNNDFTSNYDKFYWRPFQLAFFLMTYLDLEEGQNNNKNITDLIWFSTGGGKTEAYLFLAAYELLQRRRRYESTELGYGVAVITRYTLRFLTADQFTRTLSLISSLEKIRNENPTKYGLEPFSIGFYVGNDPSYNKIDEAETALNELRRDPKFKHKFQVVECPNCGTSLIPQKRDEESDVNIGIRIENNKVKFTCQNKNCFHNHVDIPAVVVDNDIFKSPPSFLLGTVDKFANVAWQDKSGSIFGANTLTKVIPPSLIIQDELHLISGPLGTVVSVYEAGFDTLIKKAYEELNFNNLNGPKYIASSATVREANKQIKRLTARETKIFPPRGLNIDDSFFAKTDPNIEYARFYLGVMPQGWRSTSAAYAVNGALLQAVRYVAQNKCDHVTDADFLWTQLCYCNSKRELNLINGATNQEILGRMKVASDAQSIDDLMSNVLIKQEISADMTESIPETRALLDRTNVSKNVIDFVPCTNMVSVGIDIDRLGLIVVNGQPKTTAEYIQATSRVGRSPNQNGPGLVVTLYSPAKPRDRSHFEHFKNYHQTLYQLVEPTSVTPGCYPALKKALHASLILTIRHGINGMNRFDAAGGFNAEDESTKNLIEEFRLRMLSIYEDNQTSYDYEKNLINQQIDEVILQWNKWANRRGSRLYYTNAKAGYDSLLHDYTNTDEPEIGYKTLRSMRSVDIEINAAL